MDVNIPRLAVSMQEGILVEWLVADGDVVAVGTPLYRLETDKTETDIEAIVAGRVRLLGEAGTTYAVGTTIAELQEG